MNPISVHFSPLPILRKLSLLMGVLILTIFVCGFISLGMRLLQSNSAIFLSASMAITLTVLITTLVCSVLVPIMKVSLIKLGAMALLCFVSLIVRPLNMFVDMFLKR